MKVLLISYYWPPSGGGGVHRWLKMSKYIPDYNVDLTVYTPENPEFPAIDESTDEEVDSRLRIWKFPITEPYAFYRKFSGKKKEEKIYSGFINDKKSWKHSMSVFIRGNFFIPDARKWWIKPSIKHLSPKIAEEKFDVVISTGPPHSMHLIALGLKKKHPALKWIADFRDPWTNIDFYQQLKLTSWADRKHKNLEKAVLKTADHIVAVSWTMADEFKVISSKDNISVITNGFDDADFAEGVKLDDKITITHLGSMNKDRNPIILWKSLARLREENEKLFRRIKVQLIGQIDGSVSTSIAEFKLEKSVEQLPFVPHNEAIHIMQKSRILLLMINNTPNAKGVLTGKGFEYLGANRPILCFGPKEGDMKKLLEPYDFCQYLDYEDEEGLQLLLQNVDRFSNLPLKKDNSIDLYSRKILSGKYVDLIQSMA